MSSAIIDQSTGKVRQLDATTGSPTPVTEETVKDPPTVVRLVAGILRDVSKLLGSWTPKRIDFTNVASTGTVLAPQTIQLTHGFNGDVRWWVVDVQKGGVVSLPYIQRNLPDNRNVLTLAVYFAATLSIRVEESG